MGQFRDDTGDVVISWLVKIVLLIAIASVVLFDGLSVASAALTASDDANSAASAASDAYLSSHSVDAAYTAASQYAKTHNEVLLGDGFSVDPDGTVHLQISKTAKTLVLFRIGPLKKLATVTENGTARSIG